MNRYKAHVMTKSIYTRDVITLGLIWKSYHDASREGDGERVLLIWKFLMIIFRLSNRRNYTKEAIVLLLQYHYILPEQKAAQLAYSRFVNTQGRVGQNIPSDLHMEHLNRRLKTVLNHLSSNIQPTTIAKAAKSIGVVHTICSTFENEIQGRHTSQFLQKRSSHHHCYT